MTLHIPLSHQATALRATQPRPRPAGYRANAGRWGYWTWAMASAATTRVARSWTRGRFRRWPCPASWPNPKWMLLFIFNFTLTRLPPCALQLLQVAELIQTESWKANFPVQRCTNFCTSIILTRRRTHGGPWSAVMLKILKPWSIWRPVLMRPFSTSWSNLHILG